MEESKQAKKGKSRKQSEGPEEKKKRGKSTDKEEVKEEKKKERKPRGGKSAASAAAEPQEADDKRKSSQLDLNGDEDEDGKSAAHVTPKKSQKPKSRTQSAMKGGKKRKTVDEE